MVEVRNWRCGDMAVTSGVSHQEKCPVPGVGAHTIILNSSIWSINTHVSDTELASETPLKFYF